MTSLVRNLGYSPKLAFHDVYSIDDPTLMSFVPRPAQALLLIFPQAEESVDLHFVCFVKGDDGHLWEMDGRRKGPLDRGALKEEEDVLSEVALNRSVRKFMQREDDPRFSLVALAPSFD